VDLTPLGAPNCTLNASIYAMLPLSGTAGVYRWPPLPIPNDASLLHATYYEQGLFADLPANSAGMVLGHSSKWTIKTGNQPVGGKNYQYILNGLPTPSPTTGFSLAIANIVQFR
jgi:hypothetical protein